MSEEILDKKLNEMLNNIRTCVDDKIKAYNDGFKSAQNHEQPAPSTMEFIRNTEKTMTTYAEDISTIKNKLETVPTKTEMELAVTNAVQKVLECTDNKYAGKERVSTLEKVVYGAVGLILTSFLGAVIYLVIK